MKPFLLKDSGDLIHYTFLRFWFNLYVEHPCRDKDDHIKMFITSYTFLKISQIKSVIYTDQLLILNKNRLMNSDSLVIGSDRVNSSFFFLRFLKLYPNLRLNRWIIGSSGYVKYKHRKEKRIIVSTKTTTFSWKDFQQVVSKQHFMTTWITLRNSLVRRL